MKIELVKTFQFEAAHRSLWDGDPNRLHGHSYEVDIIVEGLCDQRLGWLVDYGEITDRFQEFYKLLDHHVLNDVDGLQSANLRDLRAWLQEHLATRLENFKDVVVRIRGRCSFEPLSMPGLSPDDNRVRFGFEAAHALPNLPQTHKCFNMHGHSFQVEVAAKTAHPLAPWLSEVYDRLDHRCLNTVEGLDNPTSEMVSRWIWKRLESAGIDLGEVIVAETCTARCVYRGE